MTQPRYAVGTYRYAHTTSTKMYTVQYWRILNSGKKALAVSRKIWQRFSSKCGANFVVKGRPLPVSIVRLPKI